IVAIDTTGTVGSASIVNGQISYDPAGGFEALAVGETALDTLRYTISDGQGGTDGATVTVTVTGTNDGPAALDDTGSVSEDGPGVVIDVLANDSDVDASDALTIVAIDTTGTVGSASIVNGQISYDPAGGFESLAVGETALDTLSYTISDGHGGTAVATVTVTVTGTNDGPAALDDTGSVSEDGPGIVIDVLPNDSAGGACDLLTIVALDTTGTVGSASIVNGQIAYDPAGGFESLAEGETALDTLSY